jgi:hypothetical protein
MIDTEDKNFIFVDEVGFCVTTRTKKGWSEIGSVPVVYNTAVGTMNISVIEFFKIWND